MNEMNKEAKADPVVNVPSDPIKPMIDRTEAIEPGYSVAWHLVRTLVLAVFICSFGLWLARSATLIDWLLFPVFLVIANTIEYFTHRVPMHHPMFPRLLYTNHTLSHHRAFLHNSMPIQQPRELSLIMMPWYTIIGLFIVFSPIAIAAGVLHGPGLAGIFYLTTILYFILYETCHALYHMPDAFLHKIGLDGRLFRAMQSHHRHHHRPDRMSKVNFNVTFPLTDIFMGTREREVPTSS